ncbi:hypothetical protein AB0C28_49130 [Nonomuraea sp. NPDC048892]|uniref:hypothetical protein n=1 Tax=Nonomuraea sp. NPDC048892 TaxID=3154624 RepID=UPI00340C6656
MTSTDTPAQRGPYQIDPGRYGWTLPERWTLYADTPDGIPTEIRATYFIDGVEVTFMAQPRWITNGPLRVTLDITPYDTESAERALDTDGITVQVLRSVPLGEARRIIGEWGDRIRERFYPELLPLPIPSRVESEHDYALVAGAYVQLTHRGERKPVQAMAEAAGVGRDTMSARIRRAREMGLLVTYGPGKPGGELTPKAAALLTELREGNK